MQALKTYVVCFLLCLTVLLSLDVGSAAAACRTPAQRQAVCGQASITDAQDHITERHCIGETDNQRYVNAHTNLIPHGIESQFTLRNCPVDEAQQVAHLQRICREMATDATCEVEPLENNRERWTSALRDAAGFRIITGYIQDPDDPAESATTNGVRLTFDRADNNLISIFPRVGD